MYTIEYGPKGRRISMPGLSLPLVIPRAEMLTTHGAIDLQITDRDGKTRDVAEFKLNYRRLIADA